MSESDLVKACLTVIAALQASQVAGGETISFAREVAPIVAQKCVTCHNVEKRKGGYTLETFSAMLQPGESKEQPIVAGHPEKSRLFELITTKDEDDRMPQKSEPLPPGQVGLIERWIKEGAKFDGADRAASLHELIASSHPAPPETYIRPVPIRSLAFNDKGTELAVGGYYEVTFWQPEEGKLARRIKNVAQDVYALAYSPDGRLLAAASGTPGRLGQVNLLEAPASSAGKVLGTARDAFLAVAFSPSGERLAAAGADNTIRVYATESGRQEIVIEQHADWVMAVAFSDDGSLLASASRDKTARIFDSRKGEIESTYAGHSEGIFGVALFEGAKRACSAGRDLQVWEVKEGKKLDEAKGLDVLRLIARGNQVFVCCADKTIRQYGCDKKIEHVRTFSGHQDVPYAVDYNEATGRLASGSYDGEVRIWDVKDSSLVRAFIAAPTSKTLSTAK